MNVSISRRYFIKSTAWAGRVNFPPSRDAHDSSPDLNRLCQSLTVYGLSPSDFAALRNPMPCLKSPRHATFLLTSIGLAFAHFVAQSPSCPLFCCAICLLFSTKGDPNVNCYRVSNPGSSAKHCPSAKIQEGYFMFRLEPMFPSIHSIWPFFSTHALLVTKLITLLAQF